MRAGKMEGITKRIGGEVTEEVATQLKHDKRDDKSRTISLLTDIIFQHSEHSNRTRYVWRQ